MKILSTFIFAGMMLLGCGGSGSSNESYSKDYDGELDETVIESVSHKRGVDINEVQEDAKIIKEGNLRFETASIEKTYQSIVELLKENKGYIQRDNTNKNYNSIERSLVIRIPTLGFQKTIDAIATDVKVFDQKSISQRDVTEEFIDLEARLQAKRRLESRYLELLAKAKNVKEILDIEREIAKIREEIEAKQGRLKYLQNKVSLSTIHISFYETVEFEKPRSQSYLSRMGNALKGGVTGIGNFFIGILYLWPFILIGVIAFIVIRRLINRKSKI